MKIITNKKKFFLISKIKFKLANSNSTERIESEQSETEKNKSRYDEYDSRPIKPLDPKLLNQKLSEYSELSNEELEELKKRTAQRIRSKTADQLNLKNQKIIKTPARQLSFNSSNTNAQNRPSPRVVVNQTPTSRAKIRKRVKTQEDFRPIKNIKSNNVPGGYSPRVKENKATVAVAQKTFSPAKKQNANPQSPRKEIKNPLLKNLLSRKSIALNTESEDDETDKKLKANLEEKVKTATDNEENDEEAQKLAHLNGNESKLFDETPSVLLNISNKLSPVKKMQHLEFQSRIQKQRQEMRLQREKNFNEIKSQFKNEKKEEISESRVVSVFIPTNLTCRFC